MIKLYNTEMDRLVPITELNNDHWSIYLPEAVFLFTFPDSSSVARLSTPFPV